MSTADIGLPIKSGIDSGFNSGQKNAQTDHIPSLTCPLKVCRFLGGTTVWNQDFNSVKSDSFGKDFREPFF